MSTSYQRVILVHGKDMTGQVRMNQAYEAELILVKQFAPHRSGIRIPQFVSLKDRYDREGKTFSKKKIQAILAGATSVLEVW